MSRTSHRPATVGRSQPPGGNSRSNATRLAETGRNIARVSMGASGCRGIGVIGYCLSFTSSPAFSTRFPNTTPEIARRFRDVGLLLYCHHVWAGLSAHLPRSSALPASHPIRLTLPRPASVSCGQEGSMHPMKLLREAMRDPHPGGPGLQPGDDGRPGAPAAAAAGVSRSRRRAEIDARLRRRGGGAHRLGQAGHLRVVRGQEGRAELVLQRYAPGGDEAVLPAVGEGRNAPR